MPTNRERTTDRGKWTEEQLKEAVRLVKEEGVSKREAARQNNIPERTLRRRLEKGNFEKTGLGPSSLLGKEAEGKLVKHIATLQANGFAPKPLTVKSIAFNLAKQMGLKGNFNEVKERAGKDWFNSFLRRNPVLSIRKSQGLSEARGKGMAKDEIDKYFDLLGKTLTENDLMCKPANIFNTDESGLQLNNDPGKVVAVKGSKDVHNIISAERGENITIIGCISAEGNYLPPYCIFKGKNKKKEWEDSMPPGSSIAMNAKSSYISTEIFTDWLVNHFVPRKPSGKVLLILDGHSSHMNSLEMLETAEKNEIIMLCLPSHSTQYLQPLDRSFFKSLKHHWNEVCHNWVTSHKRQDEPNRRITRMQFGELLSKAWAQSATAKNAVNGFRSTGVYPFNRKAIPDYAFRMTQQEETNVEEIIPASYSGDQGSNMSPIGLSHLISEGINKSAENDWQLTEASSGPGILMSEGQPGPSTSAQIGITETPTKILHKVSPIPKLNKSLPKFKQSAANLTSKEYLTEKRCKKRISMEKEENKKHKNEQGVSNVKKPKSSLRKKRRFSKKRRMSVPTSSEDDLEELPLSLCDDAMSDDLNEFDDNECVECLELYTQTQSDDDWIQCVECRRWLHESCTLYGDKGKCCGCGRKDVRKKLDERKSI